MELYASGHNAWNQLRFRDRSRPSAARRQRPSSPTPTPAPELQAGDGPRHGSGGEEEEPWDLRRFVCVLADYGRARDAKAVVEVLRADWSSTLVKTSSGIHIAGQVHELAKPLYHVDAGEIQRQPTAEAANGRIAIADGDSIKEYSSWHSVPAHPCHVFKTGSGISQLVAGTTNFVALDVDADAVWTWGDGRYSGCLGRTVHGENQASSVPAVVADLQGLPTGPVVKIAAGGHAAAALTAGRDCYVWGYGAAFLSPLPTPLDLGGRDVLDVAVGEEHMIVVTEGGGVWVVGNNNNGQLGLGDGGERDGKWRGLSLTEWRQVKLEFPPGREVVGVAAGPRVSFLLVNVCNL